MPPIGFRYRSFHLGSEDQQMIIRTEVDAFGQGLTMLRALHEFDSKISFDYRGKLDAQRGAVIATEIKHNLSRLSRWTCQAMLGGIEQIKLG